MTQSEFNRLRSSIKAMSPEQVQQLRQQLDNQLAHPAPGIGRQKKSPAPAAGQAAKPTQAAPQEPKKPLTPAELDQYMLSIGLMTQLPNPAEDLDDDDPDDEPVTIQGEPLSETIIRERR
jgi:hypothetical protein